MDKKTLKKELRRLFKSMDFLTGRSLDKTKNAKLFFTIYQQLGLLWGYLGLHCKHWDGYKKIRGKAVCKICGKLKGIEEEYYLLPAKGIKIIGRMITPRRQNRIGNLTKEAATIVNDKIRFHGAMLSVDVHNEYTDKLNNGKINIAAERYVKLEEDGIAVDISKDIMGIRLRRLKKGEREYGAFVNELPKKVLKKLPLILSFTQLGKLTEVEILR